MGCLWLAACLAVAAAQEGASYLAHCDAIIERGREASAAHNGGDEAGAAAALAAAQTSFEAAIALDDGEPQAWLNAANLALNTQRFELSLDLWEGARERCRDFPDALAHVEERVETTKLGLYSVQRDKAYAADAPDVREVIRLAKLQLAVAPGNPRAEHDLGTLLFGLDEVEPGRAAVAADEYFKAARVHAAEAMGSYLGCERTAFPDAGDDDVDLAAFDGEAPFFGAAPRLEVVEDAVLFGRDALVASLALRDDDGRCAALDVYGAAEPWCPAHANAWLFQTWRKKRTEPYDHSLRRAFPPPRPGPPAGLPAVKRAALAVAFASANYYHFLTDVLPRAVFLAPALVADPKLKLLIPKLPPPLKALLASVLPEGLLDKAAKRAIEMDVSEAVPPGARVRVATLVRVAAPRVAARDDRPTHALSPAPLLRAARAAVLAAHPNATTKTDALLVVYCRRGDTALRRVADEGALEAALLALAGPRVDVKVFDGAARTPAEAVALFRAADVVVGVHGAALANALFCAPGATLVEFGFASAAARHYEHLAFAVGLAHVRVPLAADARSVSTKVVAVGDAHVAAVRAEVKKRATRGGEL